MGDPHADLMFVGEGPGEEEDMQGQAVRGPVGQLLDRLIEEIGLTRERLHRQRVKCRPPGNRDPQPERSRPAGPTSRARLELSSPTVVVTLGNFATKLLLDDHGRHHQAAGVARSLPHGRVGAHLSPGGALRGGGVGWPQMRADFVRAKECVQPGGRSGGAEG